MKRRFALLLFFALVTLSSFSQIPANYYDAAGGKTGDSLRAALRDIITAGHVKLPYTSTAFDVWDAYAFTDVHPAPDNTIVWDMYSDIPSGSPAYTFTIYSDQCGTASAEGDCYSREHMMPNSWWGGLDNAANPQYSDLHMLPPSDQYVNNMKSNHLVAETAAPTWVATNGSRVGPCSLSGFSGTVFEPINEYKGDFARAYLYIATRYMNVMSNWVLTYNYYDSQYIITTTGGNYLQWYIDMLVRWHNQDPVSQKEIDRNNAVYYNTPQNNRNPYIDHPEYVCLVWTSQYCSSAPVISQVLNLPPFPTPVDSVDVTCDITDDGFIVTSILQWCTDGSSFGNNINMLAGTAPAYYSSSHIPPQLAGTTVSYRILAVDNDGDSTFSAIHNYTVLKGEPDNHPTSFTCGAVNPSSISLIWTDALGTTIPDGYLVKASNVSFAAITDPVDGIPEADASYEKNAGAGVETLTFSGLAPGTTYYFKIYAYTNSYSNINYLLTPVIGSTTCATSTGGSGSSCATDLIISEYIEGSGTNKYIEIYNNTGAVVNLADYKLQLFSNGAGTPVQDVVLAGALADQTTIVYKNASASIYAGTAYANNAVNFNGNDAVALYKISTASYVDIFGRIGEDPGVAWTDGAFTTVNKTLVRNADVTSGITVNPAAGFPTLATEWTQSNQDVVAFLGAHTMTCGTACSLPTVQASGINITGITDSTMSISWSSGNGSAALVVVKAGSPVIGSPVAGTTYAAGTDFGSGSVLNSGEYVVYNDTGSTVGVIGLNPGVTYYVAVFEYNCDPGAELYLTPPATDSALTYSLWIGPLSESQICVSNTSASPTSVDFLTTGAFSANTYTVQMSDALGSFASPVAIGSLSSNANSGNIPCNIPAGTPSGTAYRLRLTSSSPAFISPPGPSFEIILFNPAQAPDSLSSSRNYFCTDDAGTIDLGVYGGSGTSLIWFENLCGGSPIDSGTLINLNSPTDTTHYFARWENSCSVSSCAEIVLFPQAPVSTSVSISASANPICAGSSVTFTATPTNGGSTPTYDWLVNGVSQSFNNPIFITTTLSNNDQVQAVLTSSETCVTGSPDTSGAIVMVVNPVLNVSVSIAASANPICAGSSVTFTAMPTNGGSTPTYDWLINGVSQSLNNPIFITTTLSNNDQVQAVLTSSETCVTSSPDTSASIVMSVGSVPVASVSIIASANPICAGSSVTFTATPTNGGSTPTYDWLVNGVSQSLNNPVFTSSTLLNGDQVQAVLTSSETCVTGSPDTSASIVMSVGSVPVASVSISASANPICAGSSVTFTATPTNGGSTPTYDWLVNGVSQSLNNPIFITTTLSNNDQVQAVLTSSETCVTGSPDTSASISLDYYAVGQIDLGSDTMLCAEQGILLSVGNFYSSYTWSDGSHNPSLWADTLLLGIGSQTLSLIVEDSNSCIATDSVVITFSFCTGLATNEMQGIQCWPNPAGDELILKPGQYSNIGLTAKAIDESGRVIRSWSYLPAEGNSVWIINLEGLPTGFIHLIISSESLHYYTRIIHQ